MRNALLLAMLLFGCSTSDSGDDTGSADDEMGDDGGSGIGSGSDVTPPLACDAAKITWDAPIQNTDGTCLTDLGGFKLKWSQTMGGPSENVIDIDLQSCMDMGPVQCAEDGSTAEMRTCETVVPALPQGSVYFVMTTYNLASVESDPSGEVSKTVDCP